MDIDDVVMTVINDGNGSMCGMTYAQRCKAAATGIAEYRVACTTYSDRRPGLGHGRKLKRAEIIEAASQVQEYYRRHVAEGGAA